MPDSPVFRMEVLQPTSSADSKQLSQAVHFFDSLRSLNEAARFAHDLVHGLADANDPTSFEKHVSNVRQKYPGWLQFVELTRHVKPTGSPILTVKLPPKLGNPQKRVRGCIGMRIRGTIEGVPVSGGAMVCLDCGPDPDTGEQDCFAMWFSWD